MGSSRDLLTVTDIDTVADLCVRAERLDSDRSGTVAGVDLSRRTVALLFERESTRTRFGFEARMAYLGGHAVTLAGETFQFGAGRRRSPTPHGRSRPSSTPSSLGSATTGRSNGSPPRPTCRW